jgi:DNA-binding response OmpR family regulator
VKKVPRSAVPVTSARRTLLVVEDDPDLRRMFRMALALAEFDVVEASDGLHALRRIEEITPDAVVLDLMMPRVNGFAVLQDLLGRAHTRQIPIVIVTATAAAVSEANVACVLRKPISPDVLVRSVRACLASAAPAGH